MSEKAPSSLQSTGPLQGDSREHKPKKLFSRKFLFIFLPAFVFFFSLIEVLIFVFFHFTTNSLVSGNTTVKVINILMAIQTVVFAIAFGLVSLYKFGQTITFIVQLVSAFFKFLSICWVFYFAIYFFMEGKARTYEGGLIYLLGVGILLCSLCLCCSCVSTLAVTLGLPSKSQDPLEQKTGCIFNEAQIKKELSRELKEEYSGKQGYEEQAKFAKNGHYGELESLEANPERGDAEGETGTNGEAAIILRAKDIQAKNK